jgi:hypothetical protein
LERYNSSCKIVRKCDIETQHEYEFDPISDETPHDGVIDENKEKFNGKTKAISGMP